MNFIKLKSGTSVEGDEIVAYKAEKKYSKYIYLIAGMHGDEVESVYLLNHLLEYLKENEDLDLPLIIIPILNIDGHRIGTRTNSHGVDLNHNYPTADWSANFTDKKYHPGAAPLSEPENKYLIKLFAKYSPKLVINFHSQKPVLRYNGNCYKIADFISEFNSYPISILSEDHDNPGSLESLCLEKYDVPILTYTCPIITEKRSLKDIWEENEEALTNMLQSTILEDFTK
ncbi:MAG: succinylglutamate desuccinylase/aspartoacylase family protein [Bacteriovoracaceae bacterium]|nr:succinylglutamate desuccinylase/aspartoacylase family protein [Bacteriovoracaceae bacterium]